MAAVKEMGIVAFAVAQECKNTFAPVYRGYESCTGLGFIYLACKCKYGGSGREYATCKR